MEPSLNQGGRHWLRSRGFADNSTYIGVPDLEAMILDAQTLFVVLAAMVVASAAVTAIAWRRNPEIPALGLWALAYVLAAVGVVLLLLRGKIPDAVSIGLANASLLVAFGVGWSSIRMFYGRPAVWPLAAAGAVIWIFACQVPVFYESAPARVALGSSMLALYSGATAYEFWRGGTALGWRLASSGLMAIHTLMLLGRVAGVFLFGVTPARLLSNGGMTVLAFEAILFTFVGAFLVLMIAKERVEDKHRIAATLDPLTGVANRRGFLDEATTLAERAGRRGRSVALLLFDLDRFKLVNDTHGHAMGDRVLEIFADVSMSSLRARDRFGRLGGEEFAALLPEASGADAQIVAQRIIDAFAKAAWSLDGRLVGATVSIGIALADTGDVDLDELLRRADRALYRAKDLGRNRVEGPLLVASPPPPGRRSTRAA